MRRFGLMLPLLMLGCDAADLVRPDGVTRFSVVSAGDSHTCALSEDGVAWCWGSNSRGQLGVDQRHRIEARPVAANLAARYRSISAGRQHTCAIDLEGNGWCWGANESGQLGDGTWQDRDAPQRVMLPRRLSSISAGGAHSCATAANGTVLCWGSNQHGQSGVSGGSAIRVPVLVVGAPIASMVSAGGSHSCAVGTAGLFCWGANDRVQLGSATRDDSPLPVRLSAPSLVIQVAAGAAHACALDTDRNLVCWGDNRAAQLGGGIGVEAIGTGVLVPLPHLFFEAVAAGGNQSCTAVRTEVWCWGEMIDPDLGPVATIPHIVAGVTGPISSMSVGARHACVISEGTFRCWGEGTSGQLGQGR